MDPTAGSSSETAANSARTTRDPLKLVNDM
jgi:hypothetical protein